MGASRGPPERLIDPEFDQDQASACVIVISQEN